MENKTAAKGIVIIVVFGFGWLGGSWFAPEEKVVEKIVEVKVVEHLPASNQDVYNYCASQARGTLYSTWDGKPREGTTPKNTQDFISDCFTKLTTNH